jgi:hypothetical protein
MSDIIDNEILISLIQERPVLWDETLEIFRDRDATRNILPSSLAKKIVKEVRQQVP